MRNVFLASFVFVLSSWHVCSAAILIENLGAGFRSGVITSPTGSRVVGYDFTIGQNDLLLTALGTFSTNGVGLATPMAVAIWDTSQNLIASEVVPSGSAGFSDGEFRFLSLSSPILLNRNQSYVLGTRQTEGGTRRYYDGAAVTSAEIAVGQGRLRSEFMSYSVPIDSMFPSQFLGGTGMIAGPNMQFSVVAVPEPSSALTVLAVCAGIAARRRRNCTAAVGC